MINVQPYLDKLEMLRDYIHGAIDDSGRVFVINWKVVPKYSIEQIFLVWHGLGVLLSGEEITSTRVKMTFDEYLKLNNKSCA